MNETSFIAGAFPLFTIGAAAFLVRCGSIHFILSEGLVSVIADPSTQHSLHLFDFHELRRGGFHAVQMDVCDIGATLCFQIVSRVVDNTFDFMQLLSPPE